MSHRGDSTGGAQACQQVSGFPWGLAFIVLAFLAFAGMVILSGVWGMRAGRNKERLKDAKSDLDAVAVATRAEAGVDRLSYDARRDKLFWKYGRILPDRKADPR